MKLKPCWVCGTAAPDGCCDKHPRPTRKDPPNRPSSSKRGYDWRWRQWAKRYLRCNPWCVDCAARGRYESATEVHHIQKIKDAPELKTELSNVMGLCGPCHDRRSARGE